ncbi:MAG: MarR family transcriptional regulator [Henriciella sp.]|nr:MarR family transcriptional regulator [Henriciella sp.]
MTESKSADPILFQVFNEIGIINQLSSTWFAKRLAPDLNLSEFGVLNHFVRLGGAKSPSRLARAFQMTKPSMTAILGKLSAKGYVEVVSSQKDRRQKLVTITSEGRAARERGIKALVPVAGELQSKLKMDDVSKILPTLTLLREVLDEARNEEDDLNR